MIFLASWYEAEIINSFFFEGRYYFLTSFIALTDVRFGLSCLTRREKARGLLDEKCFPSPRVAGHKHDNKKPQIILKLSFPLQ